MVFFLLPFVWADPPSPRPIVPAARLSHFQKPGLSAGRGR